MEELQQQESKEQLMGTEDEDQTHGAAAYAADGMVWNDDASLLMLLMVRLMRQTRMKMKRLMQTPRLMMPLLLQQNSMTCLDELSVEVLVVLVVPDWERMIQRAVAHDIGESQVVDEV